MWQETKFNETTRGGEKAASISRNTADLKSNGREITQKLSFARAKYRNDLPQLSNEIFLTDGGLETTLIFHQGLNLPHFASFPLLDDPAGLRELQNYYRQYAAFARDSGVGFILESVSWRANSDWAGKLGYADKALADVNRRSIEFLGEIRREFEMEQSKMVISGCVGPRGDGYAAEKKMTAQEARDYHARQINIFSETEADMIAAFTLNYVEEAIGIALAAQVANIPAAISFTVETDGKLPSGQTLKQAIEAVDTATDAFPAYYMINCAHPTHFENILSSGENWLDRIGGIRANSSTKSHAELDESDELDEGNPAELGRQYRELFGKLKNLRVVGGCCGTDFRHIKEIAGACVKKT